MTTDFINLITGIFKTYGLHAGFLIGLLYLFFFKYVPDHQAALKEYLEMNDKRLRDVVDTFTKTLEAERVNSEKLFSMLSTQHEKFFAAQEKMINTVLDRLNKKDSE